jgi:tRNA(Ile)-lysidine synthase TilS/MesJ
LKLIAGLAMFPLEQQRLMLRAMDAADDSWAEGAVLEDARIRQNVLRRHLKSVDEERQAAVTRLRQALESKRAEGQSLVDEIDRQIAALQQKREQAIALTSTAVANLEQEERLLESSVEQSRRGITQVINALSQLMTFFSEGAAPVSAGPVAPPPSGRAR